MRAVADTRRSLSVSVPDPVAGPGEVVIDVVAARVNRADLPPDQGISTAEGASEVLGLEVSGRISALGPGRRRVVRRR